jgi:hypothetical protein
MERFRDLSSLLDGPPASHVDDTPRVGVEAEATRYRRLVEDWNGVVEEDPENRGLLSLSTSPLVQ